MPHVLTVRWPLFARLEAVLFFPIALLLASESGRVETIIDRWVAPTLSPLGARLGVPTRTTFWVEVAIVVVVPWFVSLIVADRFLTIRKGFALLSVAAISAWVWTAMHFSGQLADLLPARIVNAATWLTFNAEAALVVGILAFLLHLRPLWVGIRDQGDVAMRLIADREESAYRPDSTDLAHAQDVYYRQTADFRGWRPQDQLEGLGHGPKESSAVKVLSALTWIAVIAVTGFAYHNWDSLASGNHTVAKAAPEPEVNTGPPAVPHNASAGPPAMPLTPLPAMPLSPLPAMPLSPLPPAASARPVATAALPAVQRPTDVSANGQSSSMYVGANEAVAERGNDGSFVFDAVVNGGHARMVFDTGASVVVLRPEDAVGLGISMKRLVYSGRIKTANGTSEVAPVVIDTLMIGNITLRNVVGCVTRPGALHENLLGQAFLARLAGFNVEKNLLVLKGR